MASRTAGGAALELGSVRLRGRAMIGSKLVTLVAVLIGLCAASAVLRTGHLEGPFWIDEGLSVGIASHHLWDIPGLLRQDGSPPLYYMLLHVWTGAFGSSVATAHLLSLVFALLSIPAALWAGWSLFGRRAGLLFAGVVAVNPMLTAYGQEARMYSLLAFLGLVTAAAHVHSFVYRRRAHLPLFALGLTLMLYTHNWSAFFALGAAAALGPALVRPEERRGVIVDAVMAFGGAGLLYLAWVPTVLSQAAHTGAPWASHPKLTALTHVPYVIAGSAEIGMALLIAGGAGVAAALGAREAGRERVAVLSLLVLAVVGLLVAFSYSQVTLAWAPRYLTVLLGPVLLLAALGLARAGTLGLVAAALAIALSLGLTGPKDKSNVDRVGKRFDGRVHAGDLVLSTQPEQVPNLRYYLPTGLDYATPLGPVKDPRVMDWRDAVAKLRSAHTATHLRPIIEALPPGRQLLVVSPVTRRDGWRARWTRLVRNRSRRWTRTIARDPSLRRVAALHPSHQSRLSTVKATLYVKRRDALDPR